MFLHAVINLNPAVHYEFKVDLRALPTVGESWDDAGYESINLCVSYAPCIYLFRKGIKQ